MTAFESQDCLSDAVADQVHFAARQTLVASARPAAINIKSIPEAYLYLAELILFELEDNALLFQRTDWIHHIYWEFGAGQAHYHLTQGSFGNVPGHNRLENL